jgi:RecA-family ATPase
MTTVKEKPAVDAAGNNGKELVNSIIAQNNIELLLDANFNKNDYPKLVEIIRQEPIEAFRNKYIRILAEKFQLSFIDVSRDVERKQQEDINLSEKLRSFNSIVASEDSEMKYVIDMLLPESCILLVVGRRGKKKSIIAMRMAIDIATGQKFLGWNTTPTETIYVDMENNIRLIKKRLKLMSETDNIPKLQFLLRQDILGIDIEDEKQRNELKELVKNKVIVFDTLSKIHKREENSNPHMNIVFGHIIMLAQQHAKAVILLHHEGKGEKLGGRGASAIEDNPDIVIEISSNDNNINFKCTKHRDNKEDDISKLLEVNFTDEKIEIKDISDQEFQTFFWKLKDEYEKDNSVFSSQNRIIETMTKHSYSKEKIIELLKNACNSELLRKTRGENNSTRYYFN